MYQKLTFTFLQQTLYAKTSTRPILYIDTIFHSLFADQTIDKPSLFSELRHWAILGRRRANSPIMLRTVLSLLHGSGYDAMAGCLGDCSGRGECWNGTCYCEIQYSGDTCNGPNLPYHRGKYCTYTKFGWVSLFQNDLSWSTIHINWVSGRN